VVICVAFFFNCKLRSRQIFKIILFERSADYHNIIKEKYSPLYQITVTEGELSR